MWNSMTSHIVMSVVVTYPPKKYINISILKKIQILKHMHV